MSHSTYSPPAAQKSAGFWDTLKQAGIQLITAKTMAEIDRTRPRETIIIRSPVSNQAGSTTVIANGFFRNLSDVQIAGLVSAGLLSVVLIANLAKG